MQAVMTTKGQVTVPKKIRDMLHLNAGDRLEFILDQDGVIRVIPVTVPVTKLKGMVPPPKRKVSLKEMKKAIAEGAAGK